MVSRYIKKFTNIIVNNMSPLYVRFPQTEDELNETKRKFQQNFGFPGVVGLIDGTHVQLSGLRRDVEHAFVNRKGDHSINVQIACNSDMVITNVNARYSGSTHDSFIFANSILFTVLENIYHNNPNQWNWLLGNIVRAFSHLLIPTYRSSSS